MTSDRKTEFPPTARQAGPGRFRRVTPALLLAGVLLALTGLGDSVQAMQEQTDWLEELIQTHRTAEGAVILAPRVYSTAHVSRAETHEYLERLGLERLGLDSGALLNPEVRIRGSDAFHGVLEARTDWAAYRLELNGKFASRQFTEVLGQGMTVTAVISADGLRILDDRGGSRTESYRRFPLDACDRGSVGGGFDHHVVRTRPGGCVDPLLFSPTFDEARDDHGTITEVVRDSQGLPVGVRFGESLLLRHRFTPRLPASPGTGRVRRSLARAVSVGPDRRSDVGDRDRLRRCRQGGFRASGSFGGLAGFQRSSPLRGRKGVRRGKGALAALRAPAPRHDFRCRLANRPCQWRQESKPAVPCRLHRRSRASLDQNRGRRPEHRRGGAAQQPELGPGLVCSSRHRNVDGGHAVGKTVADRGAAECVAG